MTGPLFPGNYSTIWIRGRFITMDGQPVRGKLSLFPTVTGGALVNRSAKLIMSSAVFSADTGNDGYVAVQVPATNDPDLTPVNFTYSVTTPIGQMFSIVVPYDTTPLNSVGDPLHGQPVIELIDVVPVGSSGGTGQLLRGIGVQSMVDNGASGLLITYTDGSTTTIAMPSTVQGPPGPAGPASTVPGPQGPPGDVSAAQLSAAVAAAKLADRPDLSTTGAAVGRVLAATEVDGSGVPIAHGYRAVAPLLAEQVVKTSAYTATAGQLVPVDTSSAAVTVTLPTVAAAGDAATVAVRWEAGSTNAATVAAAGSDKIGSGTAGTLVLPLTGETLTLQSVPGSARWRVISGFKPQSALDARYRWFFEPRDYGAVGDGTTNDSAAFTACFVAAANAHGVVGIRPGTYVIDNVGVLASTKIEALGADPYRFGSTGVTLLHLAGSSNPCLVLNGGGTTLEGVTLDGNGAPGTVLRVAHGFENRIRSVRVINGTGIGLDIRGCGNATYEDVFVDNCGSSTLPGVLISSSSQAINTLDMYGLTIERCAGTHLQIGETGDTKVPEFLRFTNLHIEAVANNGGIENTAPLVHIKRGRSIDFVNPFLYSGPGLAIRHEETGAEAFLGGVQIQGGTLLGKPVETGFRPDRLVDLLAGDEFSINGTRLDNTQFGAIRAGASYGARVFIGADVLTTSRVSAAFEDLRTGARNPLRLRSGASIQGPILSEQTTLGRPVISAVPASAPSPTMSQHTDTKGMGFFGSSATPAAGPQVLVAYSRAYATQPTVVVCPTNAATAALDIFIESLSDGTGFRVHARVAPGVSQANGTYAFSYVVIG